MTVPISASRSMPSRGFFGFGAFSASWPSENSERKKSRPSNVGPRAFTFQMSFLSSVPCTSMRVMTLSEKSGK